VTGADGFASAGFCCGGIVCVCAAAGTAKPIASAMAVKLAPDLNDM
jgi:hypothetical protein